MCLATNIARRAGSASYYARLAVPKDLQAILKKRELWKSLDTKDPREARARVAPVLAKWHADFVDLRRRREAKPEDVQAATWQHYQEELAHYQVERLSLPSETQIEEAVQRVQRRIEAGDVGVAPLAFIDVAADALVLRGQSELQREFRARREKAIRKHLAAGEVGIIEGQALDLVRREGWAIEPGSAAFLDLCQKLQRAELEALRRQNEQDQGDFTGAPRDPAVKGPQPTLHAVAAPGEGVMELFEVFANENPKNVKPDTIRMNREIVGWFAQHVGRTFPASKIDKKSVREWKQALTKFPIKAAEVREFRGLSFKKIITANGDARRPTLSDRTINKYLSALGAFCQWLMQNGHLEVNPVEGMQLGKERNRSRVRPYTSEELTRIFNSPLFTGCVADDQAHCPGNVHLSDHRYWLPLLSLFTGARMNELAQLLVGDVRQDRGRWIIHVTREGGDGKTTKTKGSQRVIPVHAELAHLGFLSYHAKRIAAGDRRLFPEIESDARDHLSGHFSRFWGRYIARIGVKKDASVNFHSFRHGMADALRRAGYRDEEFGFLLGHTQATTTGRYGILSEGDLAQRCKMIDAVDFEGLDLSHLHKSLGQ
ncbi:Site-specific recombinase XerD [Methylobacterium sp. 174MFSha1.1]|uniref:site-specific integrase n=1 Tax=Methylobacterium sp. 174MFSha1.1 TaxID=1502749 RepID=UPI0008EC9951|nr:site-specific integrase [Methylobacterium sp. 174MFSha1.1]SFU53257.1 Site-specific recombinase XerD [Methylobacterium sp. 174MFSha1.1]